MVLELERWARDARRHGFLKEAVRIEGQVKAFRRGGVPDEFPPEEDRTECHTREELLAPKDLKEARERIVQILSAVKLGPGKPFLILDVAKEINKKVGRYLGDELTVEDLILPSKNAGTHKNPIQQGFEEFYLVDRKRVGGIYNRTLKALTKRDGMGSRYLTLGEIRDTGLNITLLKKPNIGMNTLRFVQTAFARPQAEEQ